MIFSSIYANDDLSRYPEAIQKAIRFVAEMRKTCIFMIKWKMRHWFMPQKDVMQCFSPMIFTDRESGLTDILYITGKL